MSDSKSNRQFFNLVVGKKLRMSQWPDGHHVVPDVLVDPDAGMFNGKFHDSEGNLGSTMEFFIGTGWATDKINGWEIMGVPEGKS